MEARTLANEPDSGFILDNFTMPPHPLGDTFGTLAERLRDKGGTDGLIETEESSPDGREVRVVFWTEVSDETEARIVGSVAYWCAGFDSGSPLPTGGRGISSLPPE
jgi:hypothetical protein